MIMRKRLTTPIAHESTRILTKKVYIVLLAENQLSRCFLNRA